MVARDLRFVVLGEDDTHVNFEPHPLTMAALRTALEERGVLFIDGNGTGPGVCMKTPEEMK